MVTLIFQLFLGDENTEWEPEAVSEELISNFDEGMKTPRPKLQTKVFISKILRFFNDFLEQVK